MTHPISQRAPSSTHAVHRDEPAADLPAGDVMDMDVTPPSSPRRAGPPQAGGLYRTYSSQHMLTPDEQGSPLALAPFRTPPELRRHRPITQQPARAAQGGSEAPGRSESKVRRILARSSSEALLTRRGLGTHYQIVVPRLELIEAGEYVAPQIYQPTPEGLRTLIQAHKQFNHVDFRVHEKGPDTDDRVAERLTEFMEHADLSMLGPNHPVGVILAHQQMHAIPVFLAVEAGKKYMIVLDSTSGPIARQYWHVADRFPGFEVRLNAGTRQADNQSCINDAFEMLKQCFTVGNLIPRIESRLLEQSSQNINSRLKIQRQTQPKNFSLFNLPEELAFLIQRDTYFNESDLEMERPITVNGFTCPLSMHVRMSSDFGRTTREGAARPSERIIKVNAFLYQASQQHGKTIEHMLGADAA